MEMPSAIYFFSKPIYVFLALIFLIIIFHCFFILYLGLKDIGWKVVDYFWLLFAAFTIFSMAYQIRVEWHGIDVVINKLIKENSLSSFKNKAKHAVGKDICLEKNSLKNSDEYEFACSKFRDLTKEVIDSSADRNILFLSFINDYEIEKIRKSLKKNELIEELDSLVKAHGDFSGHIDNFNKATLLVQRNEAEKIMIYTIPLFFIIALALRITKVTGEILLKINSNIPGVWRRRVNSFEEKLLQKFREKLVNRKGSIS